MSEAIRPQSRARHIPTLKRNKQNWGIFTSASTLCKPSPASITPNMKGAISVRSVKKRIYAGQETARPHPFEIATLAKPHQSDHSNLVSSARQILGGITLPSFACNSSSGSSFILACPPRYNISRFRNHFRFRLLVGKN